MRDSFVRNLMAFAQADPNVILVTGDMGFGVLQPYKDRFPAQYVNVGIAEQAMTGFATGLALEGNIVFTYSIANFPTLRCLEQIRNDAAYHDANVKIVSVGGGFAYGALGMSHHATEDIAILRALPDVAVFTPGDPYETDACMQALYRYPGTCYLRLGRGGDPLIHAAAISDYQPGKALRLREGSDCYLFSAGGILGEANTAAQMLNDAGISCGLASFPMVKPIDSELIKEIALSVPAIFTVEEHNIVGGFGTAVSEVIAELPGDRACVQRIGLADCYSSVVGTQHFLREYYGMSSKKIVQRVIKHLAAAKTAISL